MFRKNRHIHYDKDLQIEAYYLKGIVEKFPNHFHECYVIGYIKNGKRQLCCKNANYNLAKGDIVIFNPEDAHLCQPIDNQALDYHALNISTSVMKKVVKEISGQGSLPEFINTVVSDNVLEDYLSKLHTAIYQNLPKREKEKFLFYLIDQLLHKQVKVLNKTDTIEKSQNIKLLCDYMEKHFPDNITLDDLLSLTNFGKSYLLRSFTNQVGVSPYRYLQNIRISNAKEFLKKGCVPAEVAFSTGFSSQSHFTNYFKEFIGLTPKQYQKIFTDSSKQKE